MAQPTDVIVVGAGIVGCAIARELARRGVSVDVIDERGVGLGATQASAGMLAPYIEAQEGHPLFELAARSLDLYDDFVAGLTADSGVPVTYRRTGTLDIATDETALEALRHTADVLARRGVAAELVNGRVAREQEPYLPEDVAGGLLIPAHGFVSATELTLAATSAARRHGAQLLAPRRVLRIAQADRHLGVETDRGTVEADVVVLAAGCWSGLIAIDGLAGRVPVRPVRGQLLCLSWNGPRLRRIVWSARCYFVPWDDGTVLVGATEEQAGFDERTTVAGVRDLLEAACDIAPHTWTAGFVAARAGLRPGTTDDLPIIGPSVAMANLIYATGHYRNGVLLAPLTARLVADAIIDRRVDPALAPFAPDRFGHL